MSDEDLVPAEYFLDDEVASVFNKAFTRLTKLYNINK